MNTKRVCRHCGDELLEDAPPHVTSCIAYADWRAKEAGDMLDEDTAANLTLFKFWCQFAVAQRDGLELLPELEP